MKRPTRRRPRQYERHTPHDAYSKSVFSELPQARGFFRGHLPPPIAARIDFSTLQLESGTLHADDLTTEFSDLLFSAQLLGETERRLIQLLFEHKRRPESTTPRQLFGYISRQFARTPTNESLPCILTVLLLQSGHWNPSPTLSSEYDLPDDVRGEWAPYLIDFRMIVVALSELDEQELRGTEAGRLALALLKSVGEEQPLRWTKFHGILSDLCTNLPQDEVERTFRRAVYYLLSVTEPAAEPEIRASLSEVAERYEPIKETAMTLLEDLQNRGVKAGKREGLKLGKQQGRKLGQHEGRVEMLVRMLSAAFPEFTAADATDVARLDIAALDSLADAVAKRRPWKDVRKLLQA